jgi:hypothetical protein
VSKAACFRAEFRNDLSMSSSYKTGGPVTLTEEQILALHSELIKMRHDVNGRLANIVAAAELMRFRPESTAERLKLLLEQPHKAAESIGEFSRRFESSFGLVRA